MVLDAGDIPREVVERVAREMNFSETTFAMAPMEAGHAARVRLEYGADRDMPTRIEVGGAVMPVVMGTLVGAEP